MLHREKYGPTLICMKFVALSEFSIHLTSCSLGRLVNTRMFLPLHVFFCTFIFRRRLIVGNPICVRGWAHMGWSIQYNSHPDSGCKMATDLQKVDSFKKKKKNKRYRLGDYGGHPHEPRHTHTLVHSQGIQHNVIKYFIRILKPQKVCPFSSSFPFCQFLYFLSLWQVNSSSQ